MVYIHATSSLVTVLQLVPVQSHGGEGNVCKDVVLRDFMFWNVVPRTVMSSFMDFTHAIASLACCRSW